MNAYGAHRETGALGGLHPYARVTLFLVFYFVVAIFMSVLFAAGAGALAAFGAIRLPEIDEQLLAHGTEGIVAVISRFMLPLAVVTGLYSIAYTWAFARIVDRRPLRSFGLRLTPGWFGSFAKGAGIAFAILAVVFALSVATGAVEFQGFTRPAPETASVPAYLLGTLVAFLLVGIYEELMFRGYVLQTLNERAGKTGAILISSVVFALLHGANPGANAMAIVNTIAVAVLLAFLYYRTGALWMPIGFHFAWNFSLGYVFTLPVSGLPIRGMLKVVEKGAAGTEPGAYGPESDLPTTLVLLALVVWLAVRRASTRAAR